MTKWEFKEFIYKNTGIEVNTFHRRGFLKFTYPPLSKFYITSLTYKDLSILKRKTINDLKKELVKKLLTYKEIN